jgi:threonine dehydrogenase-like Zn-dependent dehydrogenase
MSSKNSYQTEIGFHLPDSMLVWNLYGAGYENLGKSGKPETRPVPNPASDQILVRIDSVGICFSDVKLIQQGENHPKLKGIDLEKTPTRPGHEVSFTVVGMGDNLQEQFEVGQRFAVQPEVIQGGIYKTYGFNIPGGLTQYQLIGPELLSTDDGISLVEVDESISWAEASLLEPWGSVISGYDLKRIEPKLNGKMWIIGGSPDLPQFIFSEFLNFPELILLSGITENLESQIRSSARNVQVKDLDQEYDFAGISSEYAGSQGFDDIVLLEPRSPELVESLISLAARGGKINLVGSQPLTNPVSLDVQRIHYDHITIVGNTGPDIAESYRPQRNRRELKPGGTTALIGAGGPIGQMHFQRALNLASPPNRILVIDKNQERMDRLKGQFPDGGRMGNPELHFINPEQTQTSLISDIRECINEQWIDDVVVLVPNSAIMEDALSILRDDGMINLFAGTPSGTSISFDLSRVYLGNLQISGTSGLNKHYQQKALQLSGQGDIDLNEPIAAVGGMFAAAEAIRATEERIYPGKIIIYPQVVDLPLKSIKTLGEEYPSLADKLKHGIYWSDEAERCLMEIYGVNTG